MEESLSTPVPQILSERDVIIEVLEMYKDLPCLWDISHNSYKNKDARQQALEILVEIWKKMDDQATIEGVKKKIENMRAAFGREWKKVSYLCILLLTENKIIISVAFGRKGRNLLTPFFLIYI